MLHFIIYVFLLVLLFIGIDYLSSIKFSGNYYLVHCICNLLIVIITLNDVIKVYQNPLFGSEVSNAIYASILTYALHFYHIIWYFRKLRFDDWIHHGLMVFIALPIANYFGSNRLLGHSLFYTTGLPGMIDYFLLFLVRNNIIAKITEKRVNLYLNAYLRCPGCIIHSFLTFLFIQGLSNTFDIILGGLTALLVYWNGIYFMEQVVGNYHEVMYHRNLKII
jgi:hypothetical protein